VPSEKPTIRSDLRYSTLNDVIMNSEQKVLTASGIFSLKLRVIIY